jgi:hypothetical protein
MLKNYNYLSKEEKSVLQKKTTENCCVRLQEPKRKFKEEEKRQITLLNFGFFL